MHGQLQPTPEVLPLKSTSQSVLSLMQKNLLGSLNRWVPMESGFKVGCTIRTIFYLTLPWLRQCKDGLGKKILLSV